MQRKNVNDIHKAEQKAGGFNTKLAVLITKGFGTIWAFYILVAWMLIWMILASVGFWLFAKDIYPFAFLLFLSNLIQLWALPILATGQNVLHRKSELQSDAQFDDIEQILARLSVQDRLLQEIKAVVSEHQ